MIRREKDEVREMMSKLRRDELNELKY